MPEPITLGVQVSPSSSVEARKLVFGPNCETKVRPKPSLSDSRIGSSVARLVVVELTSSHMSFAGEEQSSNEMRRVSRAAMNMYLPPGCCAEGLPKPME